MRPDRRLVPAALALVAVVCVVAGCRRGDGLEAHADAVGRERAAQAAQLAEDAGLGDEVARFLATAAGAVGHTFAVDYDTGDGGVLTVAQDPPHRRVDVSGGALGTVVRTSLANADGAFSCERRDGTAACLPSEEEPPPVGPFAATDLERAVSSLATARRSYAMEVVDRPIAGVTARCLVTTRRPDVAPSPELGDRGELCIAPGTGAPLLVDQPGQRLAAKAYRTTVSRDAFELPGTLVTTTARPAP